MIDLHVAGLAELVVFAVVCGITWSLMARAWASLSRVRVLWMRRAWITGAPWYSGLVRISARPNRTWAVRVGRLEIHF